jgi:hypothetical protein
MGQVQTRVRNPEDKARLGSLLDQLQKARTDAETEVPGILKEKIQTAEKNKTTAQALAQQINKKQEELKAEQEKALLAKQPAQVQPPQADGAPKLPGSPGAVPAGAPGLVPPPLPEIPVDSLLGAQLRFELLKTYGGLTIK